MAGMGNQEEFLAGCPYNVEIFARQVRRFSQIILSLDNEDGHLYVRTQGWQLEFHQGPGNILAEEMLHGKGHCRAPILAFPT